MKNSKNFSVHKIALGASSTLLATLIAANGMGLANAAETHHHSEHQQTISPNSQKLAKKAQSKMAINNNNYMDQNFDLRKRCFALVGAAEDTHLNYHDNYGSFSGDIGDPRGITAGITGFTTETGDMKPMLDYYHQISPGNPLDQDRDHLKHVSESDLKAHWKDAYDNDTDNFIKAQNHQVKSDDMDVAVKYAKKDHLSQLGQYIYFDALVKHGPGKSNSNNPEDWSFGDLRSRAKAKAKTPAQGGDESTYLNNFVGQRYDSIGKENADNPDMDSDGTFDRLKFQQEELAKEDWDLKLPLDFHMNGKHFILTQDMINGFSDKDLASLN